MVSKKQFNSSLSFVISVNKMNLKSLPPLNHIICKSKGFFCNLSLSFVIPVNKMNLKSLPPLNHIICKSKDCTDNINNLKKFICPSLGITFFKMRFPPVYSHYITNFELRLSGINLFFIF